MKKTTFKATIAMVVMAGIFSVNAQQKKTLESKKLILNSPIELTNSNEEYLKEYGVVRCYTVENELALQQENKDRYKTKNFEEWIAPLVDKINADKAAGKPITGPYNIPVVVHVIHNGDPVNALTGSKTENISDAQVLSQIAVLNEDFKRMTGTRGGANTTGLAVDTQITFCMAQTSPTGTLTNGINRVNITPPNNTTAGVNDDWETRADVQAMKANTIWDPTKYMNMWSVKFGGLAPNQGGFQGILGYAQFPSSSGLGGLNANGGAASTDGVVSGYQYFGTNDNQDASFIIGATYDKGRTMTHEVGHWIGLRHIWGDGDNPNDPTTPNGSCPVDDFVADTPNARWSNGSCSVINSCGSVDQVQNYMDYTNDSCMDTFTAGQLARMEAVLEFSPRRNSLLTSTRCQAPTPLVSYSVISQDVTEGSDCGYTDVTVTLKIGKGPSATATATVVPSGTATANDFIFLGSDTVTFPINEVADKTVVIRILNDGFVEGAETLILNINVADGGGDAVVTTENTKEQIITIIDNDLLPNASTQASVYSFITDTTGVGLINANGGAQWTIFTGGVDIPGVMEPNFLGSQHVDATANDYIITPAFTIPAGITGLSISHALLSINASQNYELYFTTDTSNEAGVLAGTLLSSGAATAYNAANTLENINLNAFVGALSGQTGSLVLRHVTSVASNNGYLAWDTITLNTTSVTGIQTALNSSTPDPISLNTSGTVYTANSADGNVMVDITNTNGVNYGCVNTSVSRASGGAQVYQVPGAPNFVMDKTFTITPGTSQSSGVSTLKFYFTEVEIAAWEAATGNNRSTLAIIKDNGVTQVPVSATIGAFGTDVTLEGAFNSGINGTYYFGKLTVLNVTDNDFALFNVYPNPTNGNVNITISSNEDVQVSLFDIRGRQVYSEIHNNDSATFSKSIDFSAVSSGIYMINVQSGDKKATKKLVIQ